MMKLKPSSNYMVFLIFCFCIFPFFSNCASHSRHLLLSTPYISLTENRPPFPHYQKGSYTMVSWCPGDKVKDVSEDSAGMDVLLAKAHASTQSKYFLEATIYAQDDCLNLRGFTVVPKPEG